MGERTAPGVVRFLHTADWQLGMTRHYLEGEAQARFTGDRVEAVRRIGQLARERRCEFVVVAGDVFEHANLSARDIGRALGAMAEMGVPVFLLPGNHDPLGPSSIWTGRAFREGCPPNVTLLDAVGLWEVRAGVEIVAAPWASKAPEGDPVAHALGGLVADGTVRVLVGHGMLAELEPDRSSPTTVRRGPLDAALAAGVVHYVALGDRHIRWPRDGVGPIHYSGTHETTGFREPGRGTVLEVELQLPAQPPAGTQPCQLQVTEHQVGTWLHTVISRELDTLADVEELGQCLAALPHKERTIVKLALAGTLTLAEAARLDAVLDHHRELFASLNRWERHTDLAVIPASDEFDDLPVGGFVLGAVEELRVAAREGDGDAAGALRLLYRLVGGGTR